jgi:poly-gamma-glutamate capsule biosynthesis protein CapA/YwtB (metallophosphatase superfamily)
LLNLKNPERWSEEAADFLPKLAHATTDAGAGVFSGRGPRRLRAIEIYQGKPPPSLKDSTEKFTD